MLPQMWYAALPALVNEMTLLVKASPAIAVVGVVDLTRVTNRIAAETYEPLPPILVAGSHVHPLHRVPRAAPTAPRTAERAICRLSGDPAR